DLFFIDSDMSWDAEGFIKMILVPEEVVGGAYPVKNKWDAWTSIPKLDAKTNDGTKRLRGRALPDGSHLIEAEVLAGGFLRIRRSALERFRSAYPNDWYKEPSTNPDEPERRYTKFFAAETVNGTFNGEDHYFS